MNIKTNYLSNEIDPSGIIMVNDYHTGYWVQYVLGMQVETGNLTELKAKYPDRKIYGISMNQAQISRTITSSQELWYPFFPYSFPFGGFNLLSNLEIGGVTCRECNKLEQQARKTGNKNLSHNDTNRPLNPQNQTNPMNISNNAPPGIGNRSNAGMGLINTQNTFSTGTIIFNGETIKIYELS